MIMKKCISEKRFIEEYILPDEDDHTYRLYKEGKIDYDEDYVAEQARKKNVCIQWGIE